MKSLSSEDCLGNLCSIEDRYIHTVCTLGCMGMAQSCAVGCSDWTSGKIPLLWAWSHAGTSFLESWLMPSCLSTLKRHLDNAFNNMLWLLICPETVRQLDLMVFVGPFLLSYSVHRIHIWTHRFSRGGDELKFDLKAEQIALEAKSHNVYIPSQVARNGEQSK